MRRIAKKEGGDTDSSHDYEYTDWSSVIEFAREVSRMCNGSLAARPS